MAASFWAKRRDGRVLGQREHALDVAAVMVALLQQPVIRLRLARLGGLDDLDRVQVWRLAWFAFLHDIGKFNRGFVLRGERERATETNGHVEAARALFCDHWRPRIVTILRLRNAARWFGNDSSALPAFLSATLSHHGEPLSLKSGLDHKLVGHWRAKVLRDNYPGRCATITLAGGGDRRSA